MVAGQPLPTSPAMLVAVQVRPAIRGELPEPEPPAPETGAASPMILQTVDNFETVPWAPMRGPRVAVIPTTLPDAVTTPPKDPQTESLHWQIEAWRAGPPGILNADEQGLWQDASDHRLPSVADGADRGIGRWRARRLPDRADRHADRERGGRSVGDHG